MKPILDNLFVFEDTCNVYLIRDGRTGVLVDFGSGDVLDHLHEAGVERVTDVLMTHHHRDQGQGLQRAVDAGIRVWVPQTEQELFYSVDVMWQRREIYNNYNMRQDRFSLLDPVPIAGTLHDYETRAFGGVVLTVVPTPGHTIGSVSLMVEIDGVRVALTGDLIAAPGQVWSLSATQWTYNGAEGVPRSILSLLDVKERAPDLLLPSHGSPMRAPAEAIDLLVTRLCQLLELRGTHRQLLDMRENPYRTVTPHLLMSRTAESNYYVLRSDSGKALLIDFGYDFNTGLALGSDRAARRPWLYSLPALKRQHGVTSIDVVMPTHFHDDHVAGINLLRQVEGARLWAAETFADILEHPARYDLPCLWYDPIPVDRALPLETAIHWEEYTLTLHELPGHTLYAVAIAFEVDGERVLAAGDQYAGDNGLEFNYVYPNRFRAHDYALSAVLYRRLKPNVIVTGHWQPLWVTDEYLANLDVMGTALAQLHGDLLPDEPDMGDEGFIARISPYQAVARAGETIVFEVEVGNPFDRAVQAQVQFVAPPMWTVSGDSTISCSLSPLATHTLEFRVTPPERFAARRARVAVDVVIDGKRFGQQAEALVSHR